MVPAQQRQAGGSGSWPQHRNAAACYTAGDGQQRAAAALEAGAATGGCAAAHTPERCAGQRPWVHDASGLGGSAPATPVRRPGGIPRAAAFRWEQFAGALRRLAACPLQLRSGACTHRFMAPTCAASGGELAVALGPSDLCLDESSDEGRRALCFQCSACWTPSLQHCPGRQRAGERRASRCPSLPDAAQVQ